MTKCARAWQAEAIADGRLEGVDREAFERHVESCVDCAKEVRALERLRQAFAGLLGPTSSPLDHRRSRLKLLERASTHREPRRWWVAVAATGAVASIAAAFVFVQHRHPNPKLPVVHSDDVVFEVADIKGGRWSTLATGPSTRLRQTDGTIAVHVEHLGANQRFVLQLPDGDLEVRGTRFTIAVRDGVTEKLDVDEGVVLLRIAGTEHVYQAGEHWSMPAIANAPAPTTSVARPTTSVLANNPLPRASFEDAVAAFDVGDYGRADTLLERFVAAHPDDARSEDAAFMRVVAHVRTGDKSGASRLARAYLARWPNGLRAVEARAVVEEH